jgi:4'-phosphopantetheinyl transferase
MATVRVWKVNLERSSLAESLPLLSPDERSAAGRFGQEVLARRWVAGRAALRTILATELGRHPVDIGFAIGPAGKPELIEGGLWFNQSHSDDLSLCAVFERRVGIDVEHLRPMGDYPVLARQFFSPTEQAALTSLPAEAHERAFFRGWCCKEAYVKGRGDSILEALDHFSVEIRPDRPAALLDSDDGQPWNLTELDLGPGIIAALATEGARPEITLHDWSKR